jgi:hypothetical protein
VVLDVGCGTGILYMYMYISEWMGYCLYSGLVFPDSATLYVCAIEQSFYHNKHLFRDSRSRPPLTELHFCIERSTSTQSTESFDSLYLENETYSSVVDRTVAALPVSSERVSFIAKVIGLLRSYNELPQSIPYLLYGLMPRERNKQNKHLLK